MNIQHNTACNRSFRANPMAKLFSPDIRGEIRRNNQTAAPLGPINGTTGRSAFFTNPDLHRRPVMDIQLSGIGIQVVTCA